MICKRWTPIGKGTLLGSAEIVLDSGLILTDVLVHVTSGKPWCAVSSYPVLDSDHRQKTLADGKRDYRPALKFRDDAVKTRFREQVLAAVRAAGAAIPEDEP